MSMSGQVSVKDNKYKIKGDFHHCPGWASRFATRTMTGTCLE